MAIPRFHFTSYEKSFKVHVENLEELSVTQIQEIELFVKERKGIFDFNSYFFFIQKKINFTEFTHLLNQLNINARCTEIVKVEKEQERVAFGQYKGMLYSELPLAYLTWLKSNYFGVQKEMIARELQKRGL